MDFFGTIPMEHKNQACFMTPQLNNFTTHLKEKNVGTVNSAANLINHLNQQNQQSNLGIKNVVQKTSLDQNSDFNYNLTGFNYDTNNVKIENDSNESDISDNRNNFSFSDLRFKMDNCYNLNDHSNINGQSLGVNISLNYGLKNSKRGSGRRPSNLKEDKLTPEEEERRRIRRERNKEAAARCRKRRVEHTNNLEKETQNLEEKKQLLQLEIQKLKNESEQLLFLLRNHDCKINFNVS